MRQLAGFAVAVLLLAEMSSLPAQAPGGPGLAPERTLAERAAIPERPEITPPVERTLPERVAIPERPDVTPPVERTLPERVAIPERPDVTPPVDRTLPERVAIPERPDVTLPVERTLPERITVPERSEITLPPERTLPIPAAVEARQQMERVAELRELGPPVESTTQRPAIESVSDVHVRQAIESRQRVIDRIQAVRPDSRPVTVLQQLNDGGIPGNAVGPQSGTGRVIEIVRARREELLSTLQQERRRDDLPPQPESVDQDDIRTDTDEERERKERDRHRDRETEVKRERPEDGFPPTIEIETVVTNGRHRLGHLDDDFIFRKRLAEIDRMRDRAVVNNTPEVLDVADRLEEQAREQHERRTTERKSNGGRSGLPEPPIPPVGRR